MGIFSDIYDGVRTTLIGLKVTVPYIGRRPVTLRYPHEHPVQSDRVRNRLYVNMDDCIGCDQCSRACPVNCIAIETVKAVGDDQPGETSQGKRKALWVTKFDIDIAKCCYCGLCVPPCPTDCIWMTDVFEFSEQDRDNLIYNFVTLTPEEVVEKVKAAEENAAAAAPTTKAAATKAAAPKAAAPKAAAAAEPTAAGADDKAARVAALKAKMEAAKSAREQGGMAAASDTEASAADDKEAKIAALKAKMEAARAAREGGDGGVTPSAPADDPSAGAATAGGNSDRSGPGMSADDKAARIAELRAKMAAARAAREGEEEADAATAGGDSASGGSASTAGGAGTGGDVSAAPTGDASSAEGDDADKAARIEALKRRIAEAKQKREEE